MASQPHSPHLSSRSLSQSALDFEALLMRYPVVNEQELDMLICKFANLPPLDFGLLAANEQLGSKFDEFYADQEHKLRPPITPWTFAIPVLVVVVALTTLLVA
jgi:hypothetical protein